MPTIAFAAINDTIRELEARRSLILRHQSETYLPPAVRQARAEAFQDMIDALRKILPAH